MSRVMTTPRMLLDALALWLLVTMIVLALLIGGAIAAAYWAFCLPVRVLRSAAARR